MPRNEGKLAQISTTKLVNNYEYSSEVVIDFGDRIFIAKGLNSMQCSNEDLEFCSNHIEWNNIEIIVGFLDSLSILTA